MADAGLDEAPHVLVVVDVVQVPGGGEDREDSGEDHGDDDDHEDVHGEDAGPDEHEEDVGGEAGQHLGRHPWLQLGDDGPQQLVLLLLGVLQHAQVAATNNQNKSNVTF